MFTDSHNFAVPFIAPVSSRFARRLSAMVLCVCLVALSACGGSDETAEGSADTASTSQNSEPEDTADATEPEESGPEASATETGEPADEGSETDTGGGDEDESTDVAEDVEWPRTVAHDLGDTTIEAAPERIVVLDRSLIDAVLALEAPLAGYTTYQDPNGALPAYYGDRIDRFAADATWVGDLLSPNLEAIAGVHPDLILITSVRHEDLYDQLSAIAPTVATASAGGGWKEGFLLVAEALGRQDLGADLLADYEARAAEIGAQINDELDSPTFSVVRFIDPIRLYQPVSFSGVILEDAGIDRPESQQDRENFILQISEEELGLADADIMVYTIPNRDAVQELAADVQSRALWSTLDVVQRGEAYGVSDDIWMSGVGLIGAHRILDDLEGIFLRGEAPLSDDAEPEAAGSGADDDASDDAETAAMAVLDASIASGVSFIPSYAAFAAQWSEVVAGAGPVTVFMPVDDALVAFSQEYPDLSNELRADFDLLDQVLLYHTVDGALTPEDLSDASLATLQGEELTVVTDAGTITLADGGATVIGDPIQAANGVVYLIDNVVVPPSLR